MAAEFRHPANGYTEKVRLAWLWCLLFGSFYFAAKGIWRHAIISLVLALPTFGISLVVYPFLARRIVERSYLRRGWIPVTGEHSIVMPRPSYDAEVISAVPLQQSDSALPLRSDNTAKRAWTFGAIIKIIFMTLGVIFILALLVSFVMGYVVTHSDGRGPVETQG